MEVVIYPDAERVARHGSGLVEAMLKVKPDAVFGFATGRTPIALYRRLVERHRAGAVSFARTTSFNLDEYLGIPADSPQSYRSFMDREFFDHVDIERENTHLPACAEGENPQRVGPAYEARIRAAGGIDIDYRRARFRLGPRADFAKRRGGQDIHRRRADEPGGLGIAAEAAPARDQPAGDRRRRRGWQARSRYRRVPRNQQQHAGHAQWRRWQ